ncbi:unnamed protein product [Ixodes pacificus]
MPKSGGSQYMSRNSRRQDKNGREALQLSRLQCELLTFNKSSKCKMLKFASSMHAQPNFGRTCMLQACTRYCMTVQDASRQSTVHKYKILRKSIQVMLLSIRLKVTEY